MARRSEFSRNGVDLAGEGSIEGQLLGGFDQYRFAMVASIVVIVLVAIFFVSGADAASIVMGSLSERGTIEPAQGAPSCSGASRWARWRR